MPTFEEKKKQELEEMKRGKAAKRGAKLTSSELHCKASPELLSDIISDIGHWFGSPKVKDDEDCRQRIIAFFKHYEQTGGIPTVEKLSLALGTCPQTLWDWEVRKTKGGERSELIKAAKIWISAVDADLALLGCLDRTVYIFRAKNYYGMKDTQDVIIQAKDPLGDGASREELERRLMEDTAEIEIDVDADKYT